MPGSDAPRPHCGVPIDPRKVMRQRYEMALSRAQVAQKMSACSDFKISPDSVAKWENGFRRPRERAFRLLAKVLQCKPASLLLDEENRVVSIKERPVSQSSSSRSSVA